MTVDESYQTITSQKPHVVYVSGKTCTGKSTFGRKLRDTLDYRVIELEAVLLEIIKERGLDEQSTFHKVLCDAREFEEKALFLKATDRIITDALAKSRPVVIEGAVANVEMLQRILRPATNFLFLYFHPNDTEIYIRNLTKRFMQSGEESYGGLPLKFWQFVDNEEFKRFCKTRKLTESLRESIRHYALASQKKSSMRLEEFRHSFSGIIMAEIQ